ncbi:MAG TPA: NAD(P)/FAD-dependent oxidoreductase [Bacillota bacterium]|nr:NAD(P)/FAD-dependent oxidoreductase [Bacillota bacterium]
MSHQVDVCVVGSGPSGLGAAIECARYGLSVIVLDSNLQAGGQLNKQIHKFFGSSAHRAGTRGILIAQELLEEALSLGVRVWLDSEVYSVSNDLSLQILKGVRASKVTADRAAHPCTLMCRYLVIATGASEKPALFPGWTLPGVMSAGAVQTMMNLERVLPGRNFIVVGAGNVGLIVAYQLLQAGAQVSCVVESNKEIGGYAVHAAKIRRCGVPILTETTVIRVLGIDQVEAAEIGRIGADWNRKDSARKRICVDTVCMAVGLKPYARLASLAGCAFGYYPQLGGWVPLHDEYMMTTKQNVYVVGDASGIEEGGIAEDEGRLAGLDIALRENPWERNLDLNRNRVRERLWENRSGEYMRDKGDAKRDVISRWHNLSDPSGPYDAF